jgi:hypothetical protein
MSFEIGDEVEIVRSVKSHTEGWRNVWVDGMGYRVNDGVTYRITTIDTYGKNVYLQDAITGDPIAYGWPMTCLAPASTKSQYARVIRKINAIDKIRKELGYAF